MTDSSPIALFNDPPQTSGIIHWLPSSSGKTVTFTATRFKPDGTFATGDIDITNDFTNPFSLGYKMWTDAINIYPIGYTIHGDDLMNSGFYIYVTAHQTDGQFQDITGKAQITADNDAVIISSDGRVKATSILPSGTTVSITAYDHATLMYPLGYLLPNGESRAFDTCTITIL